MKVYKKILTLLCAGLLGGSLVSCEDFLDREPFDKIDNSPEFYNSEANLRTSVNGMYTVVFTGYNSGWSRSRFGNQSGANLLSDDLAQKTPSHFTKVAPASGGGWDFSTVKKMNILIEGLEGSTLPDEVKNHWMGVFLFYRATQNFDLIQAFGDIPYYETAPTSDNMEELFKAQQDRAVSMKMMLEDLKFASEHVRKNDGNPGVEVNKAVVDAMAAKMMLFEGSWQKYHKQNKEDAKIFFQAARDFAKKVMDTGDFAIADNYHDLFISEDLGNNPEMIIYRSYVEGKATHSVMSFDIEQPQENAPSKSLIESFRSQNGLPIHQAENTQYQGDLTHADEMANRDPRLYACIDREELHYRPLYSKLSDTGYFSHKFTKPEYIDTPAGQSSTNTTDSPVLRYAEVLLIYAEAVAELNDLGAQQMTQTDLDKSVNLIRAREGVALPPLKLSGTDLTVNGVVINDPDRDADVSPILWEIRNERRVELAMEGFRKDDLRRWKKLHYADNQDNVKQNMGAYADLDAILQKLNDQAEAEGKLTEELKEQNAKSVASMKLYGGGRKGYIMPASTNLRTVEEKHYLSPLPLDQIKLYQDRGKVLKQNPGW
ncbi:MAG: RagB/SusD family nutrient uptake outer membrane protein [Porphyromonas sp.]|nr:RagB/SusD family nutrient uptake outer membrane protein [Porphyromonas sp.]